MSIGKLANGINQYIRSSSERKYSQNNEFMCQTCKKEFVDPRVLPCLHSFCIECLHKLELEQNPSTTVKRTRNERFQNILGGYFVKDNSTKFQYVKLNGISSGKDFDQIDGSHYRNIRLQSSHQNTLKCPICNFENRIPPKGVQDLPPHYLLQHRMLINSLNKGEVCLLCDLCSSEIPAVSRCTTCLLNLCSNCSKSHKGEKFFPDHQLRKLNKNNREGTGITRIRRQVMCPSHGEKELKFYCSSCSMVACTECCIEFHSDHNYESFSRAAQVYAGRIRESLERIQIIHKDTTAAIGRLNVLAQQIESKHSQVQREINNYVDSYVDAFEEHRKVLLKQADQIRKGQMQSLKMQQKEVEKKVQDIDHTLRFGEELLNEGSDFEVQSDWMGKAKLLLVVLSFAFFLLKRLEWCIKVGSSGLSSAFNSCIGTMQFLPDERAGTVKNRTVFGVVTTQVVSPTHCHITPEGLEALRNCREKQRCDLTLVTKDNCDQRLTHGAEGIEVDLRCQNGSHRQIPICIVDQQNGIYLISFTPGTSGKYCLSISIRGIPIRGSPFSVFVQNKSIHKGTFHCCTFCSSGGNKAAICGCGGRMPGGYKGCGHGYFGHPGGHHWSCCGNTLQKSECLSSFRSDGFYQLRL